MSTAFQPPTNIIGWGVDKNPSDRPGYPKEKNLDAVLAVHWDDPEQQLPKSEVFHSIERPRISRCVGTAQPPHGLSGLMRRFAYRYSEGTLAHWMMLLAADRVDVVEGLLSDAVHLRVPNLVGEMGLKSELKPHARMIPRRGAAAGAGVVGIVAAVFLMRRWLA